ncbi:hypothetical protein H257_08040 [Aphanomyces astaci]|uniref:Uncharacterized protein n=1 Tax=Aphanomyces astaci TaxID=112090 RepID=W4GFQ9_APHAT|nr:hypothetical protein H257_08040 [Aphanomyces astaci]ETV78527.1 hypothetical protein H257_08040 [Aphanomyces astaci]|eukprot:XP_009832108.1 hypothetical protein H257_08040 [Aphanomyces astaci]
MAAPPSADSSAAAWDVMQDLQFLIDDPTQYNELSVMCGGTPNDAESRDRSSIPPAAKRRRPLRDYHHRAELSRLREQVEDLKSDLARAKASSSAMHMPLWEKAARRERVEKNRSIQDNSDLRAAVHERAAFIQHMQRTLCRKPRWMALPNATVDAWQSYKLAAQPSLRTASIHAIADRQFRRQPHAFIQAGILDRTDDLFRAEPVTLPDHVMLQVINHVNFPAPASAVSAACWRTFRGGKHRSALPLPENSTETIEEVDAHTIYERFCHIQGDITGHSNNIRKLFKDDDGRDVIVWRTVLDDALVPHMSRDAVDDTWGWLVVAPHPQDQTKCRMTCLVQIPLDTRVAPQHDSTDARARPDQRDHSQTMEAILSAIHSLTRGATTATRSPDKHKPNNIPRNDNILPAMRTFLERGRLFETAMKASLNDAVARFATS